MFRVHSIYDISISESLHDAIDYEIIFYKDDLFCEKYILCNKTCPDAILISIDDIYSISIKSIFTQLYNNNKINVFEEYSNTLILIVDIYLKYNFAPNNKDDILFHKMKYPAIIMDFPIIQKQLKEFIILKYMNERLYHHTEEYTKLFESIKKIKLIKNNTHCTEYERITIHNIRAFLNTLLRLINQ